MKKYSEAFVQKVVNEYMVNPTITQAELAAKHRVPLGTMISWLHCKEKGLTPFQRYKRNRDSQLVRSWVAADERIKYIRQNRNALASDYGLAVGTVRQLVSLKKKKEKEKGEAIQC